MGCVCAQWHPVRGAAAPGAVLGTLGSPNHPHRPGTALQNTPAHTWIFLKLYCDA